MPSLSASRLRIAGAVALAGHAIRSALTSSGLGRRAALGLGVALRLAASRSATACSLSAWSSAIRKSWRFGAAFAAVSRSTSPGKHERDQRVRKRLHLEEGAVRDRLGDVLGLVLADQLGDAAVRDHHFDRCDATAADARKEPLADDALEDSGEDRAHLRLLDRREELDQAPDRLRRVDRVHRRKHEMPGLCRLQGRLGRLGVAELADEDDVGVLAQDAPERLVERAGVEPDLALVDDAACVGVEDLDRILDRDDVLPSRAVDVADAPQRASSSSRRRSLR